MALEMHFDLLKDSLPVLRINATPLAALRAQLRLALPADTIPQAARTSAEKVLQALATANES
ncbi:hypothetical protein [Caldimonas sp. KR1-144]|uniref:hypothetical protein n=1 Tax=Caldimonas sp. KR1-144 TaxID=3400911 RepID=UPI003C1076B0